MPEARGEAASAAADVSNTAWLARTLFTEFLLPFEFAAVILTVAVIAAVMLTLRKREGTKTQDPAEQSRVKASDRLRMVDHAAGGRRIADDGGPAGAQDAGLLAADGLAVVAQESLVIEVDNPGQLQAAPHADGEAGVGLAYLHARLQQHWPGACFKLEQFNQHVRARLELPQKSA